MAADGRSVAQRMAKRYFKRGADQQRFVRQMGAEANFTDATSPAGAQGYAQIMPATAAAWGVQDVHDPVQAYGAAAKHMSDYLHQYGGSWRDALTAYNAGPGRVGGSLPAETQNYIAKILGGSNATAGPTSAPASSPTQSVQLGQKSVFDEQGFEQARKRSVLANLYAQQGDTKTNPLFMSGLLSLTAPNRQDFTSSETTSRTVTDGGTTSGGGPRGHVSVASGADRPGVGVQPVVKSYLSDVAGHAKRPITITTGTNHNQMTVDGNVSDHWDGHAADLAVPVDSRQGDMLAAHALQVAGVPWSQAVHMAQQGGLYTLTPKSGPYAGRRVQVIWRTNQGGDHHSHIHVGVR